MDDATVKFLVFVAFSLACFAGGYGGRRRGWVPEPVSRPVHLHTLIWFWAPVSLISFWRLDLGPQVAVLMVSQPLLMLFGWAITVPLASWIGCTREQTGVLGIGAAISNHGFTLGAYLCYALLHPGEEALFLAIAYVMSMQLFMVLIFYPVAHHYGPESSRRVGPLIAGSFLTLRAIPLYAAVAGLVLNLAGVSVPALAKRVWFMDVLFFAGAAGAYFGIGLRLRLGDSLRYLRMHAVLAAVKFVAMPAGAAVVVAVWSVGGLISELASDVMLIEAFTPTAINLVIVANLFHLDARLASSLWLWNTLAFCAVPMPALIAAFSTGVL